MFAAPGFLSHIPQCVKRNRWKFENAASALVTLVTVFRHVFNRFTASIAHHNLNQSWRHKSPRSDLQSWKLDGLFFDDRISLLRQTAFGAGTNNIAIFSSECTLRMAISKRLRVRTEAYLIGEQTTAFGAFQLLRQVEPRLLDISSFRIIPRSCLMPILNPAG